MTKSILISFLLLRTTVFSQVTDTMPPPPSVLVYSTGKPYLQTFIETELSGLTNVELQRNYFENVHSLNTFISDNEYQGAIREIIESQNSSGKKLSIYYRQSEIEVRNRIVKILTEYDYFLLINTNVLEDLIEFQFKLFRTVGNSSSANVETINAPFNLSDDVERSEDIFINPRKNDYKELISNAIKRLFTGSSQKPIAELRFNGRKIYNGDTLVVPFDETLEVFGKSSKDRTQENISYTWRNIPLEGKGTLEIDQVILDPLPSNVQTLRFKFIQNIGGENDICQIGFKVNNQINDSEEIKFYIVPIERPHITRIEDQIYTTYYRGIFSRTNLKTKKFLELRKELNFVKHSSLRLRTSKRLTYFYSDTTTEYYSSLGRKRDFFIISDSKRNFPLFFNDSIKICDCFSEEHREYFFRTNGYIRLIDEGTQGLVYHAYYVSNDIVSRPKSFKHLIYHRSTLNLYANWSTSNIYSDSNIYENYLNISIGLFMNKNFELLLGSPMLRIRPTTNNFRTILNSSLRYHIYSKVNSPISKQGISSLYFGLGQTLAKRTSGNKHLLSIGVELGTKVRLIGGYKSTLYLFGELFLGTRFAPVYTANLHGIGRLGLSFSPNFRKLDKRFFGF